MSSMYGILIVLCIIAIGVLFINIAVVSQKKYPLMKWVCILLFIFSMTRYLTLMVYGDSPSLRQLEVLRYFYLATSIGLTIPFASSVWYVTPHLRERVSYSKYLLFFTPWILFYLYVLITQPTTIVKGESYGYTLELTGNFPLYLSIAQGSFVVVMLVLCVYGWLKYKNSALRSQYLAFILALLALTLDGFRSLIDLPALFPPFTVSEIFGFLAVFYGFVIKPLKLNK